MAKPPIPLPATNVDAGLLVLRVALAVILLFHGAYKLSHGIDWMQEPLARFHLPLAAGYGAYVAELVAPVMLIAGAWTRIAAVIIMGDMLMAFVLVLAPQFAVIKQGGAWGVEVEMMILLSALALFLAGGGKYGITRD